MSRSEPPGTTDVSAHSLRPYGGLLAVSFLSRVPLGMAGVGLLALALSSGLGPGIGGTAVGLYAASFAAAGPLWGRAAQNVGAHAVLRACWLGQILACGAVVVGQSQKAAYLVAAALLGLTTPPLAAIMRATWNHLFAGDDRLADRLSVLETMNTEGVHIAGRLIVAALAAVGAMLIPWVYAILISLGIGLLARDSRLVEPSHGRRQDGSGKRKGVWNRTNVVWAGAMLMMAVSHGAAATSMVVSQSAEIAWRGPLTMVVWAVGSLLGGLASLGRPNLASPIVTTLVGQFAFAIIAWELVRADFTETWAWLLILALGVPISPTISSVFRASRTVTAIDQQVWLFSVFASLNFLGFSVGSAAAGWVMELDGVVSGFYVAAACAGLAVVPLAFAPRLPRRLLG